MDLVYHADGHKRDAQVSLGIIQTYPPTKTNSEPAVATINTQLKPKFFRLCSFERYIGLTYKNIILELNAQYKTLTLSVKLYRESVRFAVGEQDFFFVFDYKLMTAFNRARTMMFVFYYRHDRN